VQRIPITAVEADKTGRVSPEPGSDETGR